MRGRAALLALVFATAGCSIAGGPVAPKPGSSKKPATTATTTARPTTAPVGPVLAEGTATRMVPQAGAPTQLAGKAKLLSDHGGGIISNNTGSLVSNNGGGVIANNGGGLIANNGGGIVSKAKYGLAQATPAPAGVESLLANATIEIRDAKGRVLVGPDGKPLTATTDGQGGYTLRAVLPAENLVLRIKLWNGGELSAILPRGGVGGRELPIDTAATLGATYVLTQFVKGDQATFDKLPATEADRLKASLDAARGRIAKVPTYQPDELVALTDDLRKQDPTVDKTLTEIKALLLGQANLGTGRAATEVPLTDPAATADDGQGGFYVLEGAFGRIRHVSKDGAVTVYADQLHGVVKENFFSARDLTRGADGALYVASPSAGTLSRVGPDGVVTTAAGPDGPGGGPRIRPWSVAQAPDGAFWIGEEAAEDATQPPRVMRLAPDGVLAEPAPPLPAWAGGRVVGLAIAQDGTAYTLIDMESGPGQLCKLAPGGAWTAMGGFKINKMGDLAIAADGGLLLAEDGLGRLQRVTPDGKGTVVYDPAAGGPIARVTDLVPQADGSVRVVDASNIRVFSLAPDGTATALAGSGSLASASGDAIPINAPFGVAYDAKGQLHVVETAGHSVRAWDGKELTTVVGGMRGKGGDGGPATAASLDTPTALAYRGAELLVADQRNDRLRVVRADGTIATLVGGKDGERRLAKGRAYPATGVAIKGVTALVVAPDGTVYWAVTGAHQVHRLTTDGTVMRLAGTGERGDGSEAAGSPAADAVLDTPYGLALGPDGALYVSEAAGLRIRKITDPGGDAKISTFAGAGDLGRLADMTLGAAPERAADASFAFPGPLCFDAAGNLYMAECGTLNLPVLQAATEAIAKIPFGALAKVPSRIRKITPNGTVTTVAGPGGKFFADTAAGDALVMPANLAIDPQGRLVIVDAGANVIRFLPAGSF